MQPSAQLIEDAVSAVIASSSVPQGQAAPAQSITYTAFARTAEGTSQIPIGWPRFELWPVSGPWVYPLAIGTEIHGKRVSTGHGRPGEYRWQYTETPRMRPCSP